MKHSLLYIALQAIILCAAAQTTPATVGEWAATLTRFGKALPQEKVFVHTDNTCYFLGDTIWFKAYTRRTDKSAPSGISSVLYADLLNQDGYLVERQLIEMKDGEGWGSFALCDTLYAGFYELRAYTRWQLNWGVTEHPHTPEAEKWFYSKGMAKEFYRDYERLYSRVFPIYDRPKEAGTFYHDMTLRPLRRYFKKDAPAPALTLALFPEGGRLVGGLDCNVAFEAAGEDGETRTGTLCVKENGNVITTARTVSRGRGSFTIKPDPTKRYEAEFTATDGKNITISLPAVEHHGVALNMKEASGAWTAQVQANTDTPMAMTVMHEGVVEHFEESVKPGTVISLDTKSWPAGIHQATIFDANGRIWADRLFFVTKPGLGSPTLSVSGVSAQYEPFGKIELDLQASEAAGLGDTRPTVSVAVRDATNTDYLYDSGNIMTEMLMASELKGFIPQPEYFFEADDEEHHTALDLLMLTQGWRRFDWHTMATPGAFALTQPIENPTPVLMGDVNHYPHFMREDEMTMRQMVESMVQQGQDKDEIRDQLSLSYGYYDASDEVKKLIASAPGHITANAIDNGETGESENFEVAVDLGDIETTWNMTKDDIIASGHRRTNSQDANELSRAGGIQLASEVRVHAEFQQPGSSGIVGDMETEKSRFRIQQPHFTGYCVFFLAASDTTRWKGGKTYQWVSTDANDYPDFYVRIAQPHPRFVKPYNYYQNHLAPLWETQAKRTSTGGFNLDRDMKEVTIRASHGGLRAFDPSKPAFRIDAYEAYNQACDAGLAVSYFSGQSQLRHAVARTYVGDMNMKRNYDVESRWNGRNSTFNHTPTFINRFSQLTNLDSVFIYTDYAPRNEGDPRWRQADQPTVTIDLHSIPDDGQRLTYRDRRYILQGFNEPADFYHPDYSQRRPSESDRERYRRTLYWNPALPLDADGHAHISLYNNGRQTTITVDANGQTASGTLLWGRQ